MDKPKLFKRALFFLKDCFSRGVYMRYIDHIFEKEQVAKSAIVEEILKFNPVDIDFMIEDERAFPGDEKFFRSGYYKTMLKRYFFAGKKFCENRNVLDSCCGLGWGTFIVSQYAGHIDAFDSDNRVMEFCKKQWPTKIINWITDDAINPQKIVELSYDVVLGMETIEHFSIEDGKKYVKNMAEALRDGGYFIGTSGFPNTRAEAEILCKKNQYHLHIYTSTEIKKLLRRYFSEVKIINNWMFIARK